MQDQVSREPPCEPLPPFDELAEDERFEDARGPASGSFEPEQSPGMVAAIAGATAAAAEAVYEVTADTVTAPVRVVEELVAHPVQTVKEVVTAPVAIVEDLLVAPLLGRRDEQVGGEAGGQPRSGVQERVHEYEQRTAPTGRPTAGRPSSPGRRSGESSPEAWEVIEKNGVGVKGAGAEASDAGEGPPSRGRERRPTEGTTGDSAQGPRPFAWGRKEEAAERSAQKGDGSEQRSPVPAAP